MRSHLWELGVGHEPATPARGSCLTAMHAACFLLVAEGCGRGAFYMLEVAFLPALCWELV